MLAPMAARLGLADIDLSAVTGPQRELTQEAALHVYQQMDSAGAPLFGGLRYVSRFNPQWECWAVFVDRARQRPLKVDVIAADDPHLYDAAADRVANLLAHILSTFCCRARSDSNCSARANRTLTRSWLHPARRQVSGVISM